MFLRRTHKVTWVRGVGALIGWAGHYDTVVVYCCGSMPGNAAKPNISGDVYPRTNAYVHCKHAAHRNSNCVKSAVPAFWRLCAIDDLLFRAIWTLASSSSSIYKPNPYTFHLFLS